MHGAASRKRVDRTAPESDGIVGNSCLNHGTNKKQSSFPEKAGHCVRLNFDVKSLKHATLVVTHFAATILRSQIGKGKWYQHWHCTRSFSQQLRAAAILSDSSRTHTSQHRDIDDTRCRLCRVRRKRCVEALARRVLSNCG